MGEVNENSKEITNSVSIVEYGDHINYEILPIEELRIQARNLLIENYMKLNKQKLIDAIRNAKSRL